MYKIVFNVYRCFFVFSGGAKFFFLNFDVMTL